MAGSSSHRRRGAIAALTGSVMLASCASTPLFVKKPPAPPTLQEGVSVAGAVVYTRPWDEVKDSLSPKFDNNGANALAQVLQTQSFSDFRLLSALGLSLQAGVDLGPRITTTDETTRHRDTSGSGETFETSRDETTQTVTTKRVDDNSPPDLPAAPASAAGTRTANALPDQIGAARVPASEPFFRYAAAAALYQEIGLINDAVLGIPEFADTKPYVIRVRLGVHPFRKDLPWDVYAHLSLFEDVTKVGKPVMVLPILSTEAYEGTLDAAAIQQIMDLRLALQATAGNFRGGAGFDKLNENLTSFLTRRYEPTMRVSAANGNGVDIKFGASRDKTGYALTDRDHYVTLVAYLKPPYQGQATKDYRFYMKHEARDVATARLISDDSAAVYDAYAPVARRLGLVRRDELSCPSTVEQALYHFSEDVNLGKADPLGSLNHCVSPEVTSANFLMTALSAVGGLDSISSFPMPIKPLRFAASPRFLGEAAPYVQASKKSLVVGVPYMGDLKLESVQAILMPMVGNNVAGFAPRTVTLRTSGAHNLVSLEFPSLSVLKFQGLSESDAKKLQSPSGWRICVAHEQAALSACSRSEVAMLDGIGYGRSLAQGYAEASAVEPPEFALATTVESVRLSSDGLALFAVTVAPADGRPVTISVEGAELLVNGKAESEMQVTAKGTYTLTLRNAVPGGVVRVKGVSAAAEDSSVKASHDVAVAVQAATPAKT